MPQDNDGGNEVGYIFSKGVFFVLNEKRRRPNLSEIAYDEMKDMILSGALIQGQRILLDEMSGKLNLSVAPIREALNKLAQEDLVNITPRTCHEVLSLQASDVKDILELRLLLETFALQTAGSNLAQFPTQQFREFFQFRTPGVHQDRLGRWRSCRVDIP